MQGNAQTFRADKLCNILILTFASAIRKNEEDYIPYDPFIALFGQLSGTIREYSQPEKTIFRPFIHFR
jgi:hypothetical protein